jgi:hypothetical protein
MFSCSLHMGCWDIRPNALIPSIISVLTDQINSIHKGLRYGEILSHMALPCGLIEATPSRNTRVNSHSVGCQGSTPLTCPLVLTTWDVSSCCLHKGRWAIIPNTLIPSRISVIKDQLNSVTQKYDLENVSRICKHQHSLSVREAFSGMPSLSRKYLNIMLVW